MISFANTSSTQNESNPAPIKHTRVVIRKAGLRANEYARFKQRAAQKRFPPLTKRALAQLWHRNVTIDDIAAYFGVSDEKIRTTANKYKLDPKRVVQEAYDSEWQPGDPTLEEIKERAAEIRAKWTETELRARLGERALSNAGWVPASYVYNVKRAMFVGS